MRRLLLALVLLSGCAHAKPRPFLCRTTCGLTAPGISRAECSALQDVERDTTIQLARYVAGWDEAKVCNALAGWTVEIHQFKPSDPIACGQGNWHTGFLCVLGYTHQERRAVEVGSTDWRSGALAHELVHVTTIGLENTVGHCRWQERGIKAALRDINGWADNTRPEADCAPAADGGADSK